MDTIRNYLETMFANYPVNDQVLKAKRELESMMEDKYMELINEGKAEHEAIAVVIAEFGNINDLADELGLNQAYNTRFDDHRPTLSVETIDQYVKDAEVRGQWVALGVMLCILSPVAVIIGSSFKDSLLETLGIILLFICIAIAVGLFIYSHSIIKKYDYIEEEHYTLAYGTTNYVKSLSENYAKQHLMMRIIGIALCILCVIPPIILDLFKTDFLDNVGGALLLVFIAMGVGLLVYTSCHQGAYDDLLNLNNPEEKQATHYDDPLVDKIMSVYWDTVLAIYLIYSFWTFNWGRSWIIWPLAAFIEIIIKKMFGGDDDE